MNTQSFTQAQKLTILKSAATVKTIGPMRFQRPETGQTKYTTSKIAFNA